MGAVPVPGWTPAGERRALDALRAARVSATLRALLWAILLGADPGGLGLAERWLLLAVLTLVPLGLALAATPDRAGRHSLPYRAALALQPQAALLGLARLLPRGARIRVSRRMTGMVGGGSSVRRRRPAAPPAPRGAQPR